MESILTACVRYSTSAARFLAVLLFSSVACWASASRAADEVVTDCSNDTELRADLAAMQESDGGKLTFSCPQSTIVLTDDLPVISKQTEIDGDGKITISGNNARRIFVSNETGALLLDHLVLTNGSTAGNGGAIYTQGGALLQGVVIRDSLAALGGGALYDASRRPTIRSPARALRISPAQVSFRTLRACRREKARARWRAARGFPR